MWQEIHHEYGAWRCIRYCFKMPPYCLYHSQKWAVQPSLQVICVYYLKSNCLHASYKATATVLDRFKLRLFSRMGM